MAIIPKTISHQPSTAISHQSSWPLMMYRKPFDNLHSHFVQLCAWLGVTERTIHVTVFFQGSLIASWVESITCSPLSIHCISNISVTRSACATGNMVARQLLGMIPRKDWRMLNNQSLSTIVGNDWPLSAVSNDCRQRLLIVLTEIGEPFHTNKGTC